MKFYNKYIFNKKSYLIIYQNRKMYKEWLKYNKYKIIYKCILFIIIQIFILKYYKMDKKIY